MLYLALWAVLVFLGLWMLHLLPGLGGFPAGEPITPDPSRRQHGNQR